MSLFDYQPGNRSGIYHPVNGLVCVFLEDPATPSEKLAEDALSLENSLTNAERVVASDVTGWLESNGYTALKDTAYPSYSLGKANVAAPVPSKVTNTFQAPKPEAAPETPAN